MAANRANPGGLCTSCLSSPDPDSVHLLTCFSTRRNSGDAECSNGSQCADLVPVRHDYLLRLENESSGIKGRGGSLCVVGRRDGMCVLRSTVGSVLLGFATFQGWQALIEKRARDLYLSSTFSSRLRRPTASRKSSSTLGAVACHVSLWLHTSRFGLESHPIDFETAHSITQA